MRFKRTVTGVFALLYTLTTLPTTTLAATITTTASNNRTVTTTTTINNAQQVLQGAIQGAQEEELTVRLEGAEDVVIDSLSTSQKDSYMILANKFMSQTELQAMEWNLVVSQFAVPYRENIQDVWNHTSFKDMREKGLEVNDNPYITSIKDNLNALSFSELSEAVDLGIDILSDDETVITKMNEIADIMLEDGEVTYSMVYKGDSPAYVSDLFAIDTTTLTIKDKIAVTGEAASKTELWDALQSMQDNYLVEQKTKEQLATDVTSGSTIFDIELPVWINTDSTIMYNAIYVANAIRIGGYGTFETFMSSVKNSQLYMDRWGNLCAYLKIEGEMQYVIVYPAYSNPIFTSTELADTDFAGYVYEDFDSADFWNPQGSSLAGYSDLSGNYTVADGLEYLSSADPSDIQIFSINPDAVTKSYSEIKDYVTDDINSLSDNDYLGVEGAKTVQSELAKTSDGSYFGGTYSRIRSSYLQSRDMIPIMEVDTTSNMVFNKAVLSAYSRDGYNAVTGGKGNGQSSSYYADNWYSGLSTGYTTYTKFSIPNQYNTNSREALFRDSLVFDKYYTNMLITGGKFVDNTKGMYAVYDGDKYTFQESTATIAISDWRNSESALRPEDISKNSYIFKSLEDGLKIKDPSMTGNNVITMYPWMQLNTYRKGLYSDSPTLQATKKKGFIIGGGLNTVIEDRYVSKSWNYENTITTNADHYTVGSIGGTDTQVPIEILWNTMYTDSDKFKTYVVFNYTSEAVPSNSVIYGMGHKLTKDSQGKTYYVAAYLKDTLEDNMMGRTYMSVPLLDATIDTGASWSIWEDTESGIVDSIQEGPRSRPMPTSTSAGGIAEIKDGMFFEPVEITGSESANALRFVLNDQRVSDVLENYPLEDITLLSFVWRNYYTPQTPFRTKLNEIIKTEDTEKTHKLDVDSSVAFTIGEESFLDTETTLTPFNIIASDSSKVNNTLVWTNSCSMEQESKLYPGSVGAGEGNVTGVGEVNSLGVAHTTIHRVSYNFGVLLLAVNKNTQGDNLTNLVAGYDASKEFNTDDIMNKVAYFFEHPLLSTMNIFMGFIQMVHNNVAVGNIGNIFDISWIIDLAFAKGLLQWYITVSAAICCVVLIIRGLTFIISRKRTMVSIAREWLVAICLSTVPVVLLYTLADGLKAMSTAMTKHTAGKLAAVEIEREVTASENLNINFETVYTAYKEQFDNIEDGYEKLSLQVPYRWNATTKQLDYQKVTVKELYDSIEYSNILASAKLEASALEHAMDSDDTVLTMYKEQNPAVNHLYYTYSEFVPVNYEQYSSNLFYYFYDYLKYQYLSYWANYSMVGADVELSSKAVTAADTYSAAAKNFTLPDISSNETWSTYIGRMWDAERYMLSKSYNGMYAMMHDSNYVYGKLYDADGDLVYKGAYPTDMFGMSYLFNMTNLSYNNQGYTGTIGIEYAVASQEKDQLGTWKKNVTQSFDKSMGTYSDTMNTLRKVNRTNSTNVVQNFYPLAYLMDNPVWNVIVQNRGVTDIPSSTAFKDYQFTPTFIEAEFKDDYYEGLPSVSSMTPDQVVSYSTFDSLKFNNLNATRIPWRTYASKSLLYAHTFDGDDYDTRVTKFESLLMKFNEDTYEKIRELTEYLQGDIRDSSLIFAAALIATMEFNETFSPNILVSSQIEPQSYTPESMDLDKFMRLTYASSMNDIVKNNNVIYMIYEQDGGLLTAVIVALTEIMIAITMLARVSVLFMLLLGCAYACFCYVFHEARFNQAMVTGLVSQLFQIVFSQFVLLFVVTCGMTWTSETNNTITRLLLSLITLISCFAITRWSLYMLSAVIKDFKNFGGAIIQGSVNAVKARMDAAFTTIKNNNELRNLQAVIQKANVNENIVIGSVADRLRRRTRNVHRFNDAVSQFDGEDYQLRSNDTDDLLDDDEDTFDTRPTGYSERRMVREVERRNHRMERAAHRIEINDRRQMLAQNDQAHLQSTSRRLHRQQEELRRELARAYRDNPDGFKTKTYAARLKYINTRIRTNDIQMRYETGRATKSFDRVQRARNEYDNL